METLPSCIPAVPSGSGRPPPWYPLPPTHTHHKRMVRVAKAAGLACSAGAGFGLAIGLQSPGDGWLAGLAVPLVCGTAIAVVAACGWHMLMSAAPRVTSAGAVVGSVAVAAALTTATIAGSSWGVATAISSHAAERAYLSDQLVEEGRALDAAWGGAQSEAAVIDAQTDGAVEMRALSDLEAKGVVTGDKGDGRAAKLLSAAAEGYGQRADRMRDALEDARKLHDRGRSLLQEMQQAIRTDPEVFAQRAVELQSVISDLNGFHLTGLGRDGGITRVEIAYDPTKVQRIRSGADKVTQKVLQRVKDVAEKRQVTPVPAYVPAEPRDLTLRYAGSAAIGGWVCAVAIDAVPFLFFILLLVTAHETLLNRYVEPPPPSPHPDYDFEAEQEAAQRALERRRLMLQS